MGGETFVGLVVGSMASAVMLLAVALLGFSILRRV